MKVTVCFGNVRVIVPCGDGDLLVSELIEKAITRYKKAIGKPSHYWVTIHDLRSSHGGGILDPDDSLKDVADDREQIVAHFEEQGCPPLHHNGGDGASASSVGTSSPDIFHTQELNTNSDIVVTTSDLVSGSDVVVTTSDLISVTPLRVRRGSDPCLNLVTDDPKPNFADTTGTFPKKSKRWSTFDPVPGGYITSTPKPKELDLSDEDIPNSRTSTLGSWPVIDQKQSAFSRFSRDGSRQSLSNQPLMSKWFDAQERNLEKFQMPEDRHEPLGRPSSSQSKSPSPAKERVRHTLPPVPQSPCVPQSPASPLSDTSDATFEIRLKNEAGPLGIHVVPDVDENNREQGLLVQSIEPEGRMFSDKRLRADDRIVKINSISLHDISFHSAQSVFKQALLSDELALTIVRGAPPPLPKLPPPILPRPSSKLTNMTKTDSQNSSAESSFYSRRGSIDRTHERSDIDVDFTSPPLKSLFPVNNTSASTKNHGLQLPSKSQEESVTRFNTESLPELPSSPRKLSMSKRVPPALPMRSPSTTLSNSNRDTQSETKNLDLLQTDIDESMLDNSDNVFVSGNSNSRRRLKADNAWIKADVPKNSNNNNATVEMSTNFNQKTRSNSEKLTHNGPVKTQRLSEDSSLKSQNTSQDNALKMQLFTASLSNRQPSVDEGQRKGSVKSRPESTSNHGDDSSVRISASDNVNTSANDQKPVRKQPLLSSIGNKRVIEINLTKAPSGIGFSVTTRDNPAGRNYPIYIKTILPNGPAIQDGRLQAGDMLVEVNSTPMMGLSQNEAVNVLRAIKVGEPVNLIVSRPESHPPDSYKMPRELPNECGDSDDNSGKLPSKSREIHSFNIALNETGSAGLGISVKGITVQTDRGVQDEGIFIKNVISGGAASKDSRLQINDQLLQINDELLSNLSNSQSMDCLRQAMQKDGPIVGCINIKVSRRIGPPGDTLRIVAENDMKFGDNAKDKILLDENRNVSDGDDGFVRPHVRTESIQSTNSDLSDVGALPFRARRDFESLKKRNESYSLAVRDSFEESRLAKEENSPERRRNVGETRDEPGSGDARGYPPRLSAPTVNEAAHEGEVIIEHDDEVMMRGDSTQVRQARPHSSIGLMRTVSYSSSSQDTEEPIDPADKPPSPPEWLLDWERRRSICKEDSIEHVGFQRDGFARRSLSEKRKGRHDARGTELYWKVKQQPKEKRRKWFSGFQPLMRSSSAESIFSSVDTSDLDSSFSGNLIHAGLKKSNSLESMDITSAREEPALPAATGDAKSASRVRGFNESFRAAVDRSYTSDPQPVKSMDTVDEESSESGGSVGVRGPYGTSFDDHSDDSLKRRKKKGGFLALFKFGKARKPNEQGLSPTTTQAPDYNLTQAKQSTSRDRGHNLPPPYNEPYDQSKPRDALRPQNSNEHVSRLAQHKREGSLTKQQKLTQWYQHQQQKAAANQGSSSRDNSGGNTRYHPARPGVSDSPHGAPPQNNQNVAQSHGYPTVGVPTDIPGHVHPQSRNPVHVSQSTGEINPPGKSYANYEVSRHDSNASYASSLSLLGQGTVYANEGPNPQIHGANHQKWGTGHQTQEPIYKHPGQIAQHQGPTAQNQGLIPQNQGPIYQHRGPGYQNQGSMHQNQGPAHPGKMSVMSRSDRIQNLRLEHQRRHKERNGQYPLEYDEEVREGDVSLEEIKIQRYVEQQRLPARPLPHLPPASQRGAPPQGPSIEPRVPQLHDPRHFGMVPDVPPRQPNKPIIGRMGSTGNGHSSGQSHYMNQSDINNQIARHEHYLNKYTNSAANRVTNQNSYNNRDYTNQSQHPNQIHYASTRTQSDQVKNDNRSNNPSSYPTQPSRQYAIPPDPRVNNPAFHNNVNRQYQPEQHQPEQRGVKSQYRSYTPTAQMLKSHNRGVYDDNNGDAFRARSRSVIDDYDDPRFAYRQNVPAAYSRLNPNPAQV